MTLKRNGLPSGFTLTEIIIAVAIIGILAALIVMSFNQQLFKGNDSKRKSDLNTIKIALEEYEKDKNCYPAVTAMTKCGTGTDIAIHPYLNNVPCDPINGEPYAYETDGAACSRWFRIYSRLQNVKDASVVPGIGPDSLYNFYMSSDNAPVPVVGEGGTPPPDIPGGCGESDKRYGCINHICQEIQLNQDCSPVCQPAYDVSGCLGQCEDPENPASECVPI